MFLQAARNSIHDLIITAITFAGIAGCLYLDSFHDLELQNALGKCAWVVLIGLLLWESNLVRLQVLIAVAFATAGEHFASGMMHGYIYYFHNIPAYIPPGHGMVYLTAVAMARSPLFQLWQKPVTWGVLLVMGLWSLWGVTFAERGDWVGMLLFLVYVPCVLWGRAPLVYLAAFFVTTHLELIGTALKTWTWVPIDPVLSLPQGNPPSGVAAWYCLVDAVALFGAGWLLLQWQRLQTLPAALRQWLSAPEWVHVAAED
ncbi:hypothetical protein MIT9_P1670 [Methylomarinovum caldicuralii]|uniref:TIGR02206 family membrane protein n=1 Tax=Methylomarinovum caldicuralii TaxID=438856 RepID=A0AAU9C983_9GAMM|nr:hypothetical protein [Methylomarinovum caldicuralii]BCX82086.1 hypothetical protein MIT9_P1670 [Methylomarinovum caldicuralii]